MPRVLHGCTLGHNKKSKYPEGMLGGGILGRAMRKFNHNGAELDSLLGTVAD